MPAEMVAAKSVAVSQLVGAMLFSCGSACFVWMAWVVDWVLPLKLGCAVWIVGCVPYLWPPLRNSYLGIKGTRVSNGLQVGGMMCWAVGSLPIQVFSRSRETVCVLEHHS